MAKLKANLENLKLPFKNYLAVSLAGSLVALLIVVLIQKNLPLEVPLLYGAAEGESQLTSAWGLTIPSLVSILVIIANSALATILKDEFTKKTLVLMAVVVSFFSIVTTFKIIFLVASF